MLSLRLHCVCHTGSGGVATRQIDPTQPVATGHCQTKYCCTADGRWSTRQNTQCQYYFQFNSLFQKNVKVRVVVIVRYSVMASKRDYNSKWGQCSSQTSRENCPFCGQESYSKDLLRHVRDRCKQAKAECVGKNVNDELQKRRAKRKGNKNVVEMFSKVQRTNENVSTEPAGHVEALLRETENDDMEDGANLMDLENTLDQNANTGTDVTFGIQNPIGNVEGVDIPAGVVNANAAESEERLMEKMGELAIGINQVCTRLSSVESALQESRKLDIPGIAKPSDVEPTDERLQDLRKCASVDDILQLLNEVEMDDTGLSLFCTLCCPKDAITDGQQLGKFNLSEIAYHGETDDDGRLTEEFRNLKKHLKGHIQTRPHSEQWNLWKEKEEKEERSRSKNESAGMRLARLAYEGFRRGRSLRDFEKEVLMAVQNGLSMGDYNNSWNFPFKFLQYVHEEVQILCEKFITQRTPETGYLPAMNISVDKGTVHHRSMQFTTAVVALANSDQLLANIYLGQPVVRDHTAQGLAQTIVDELKRNKIQPSQVEVTPWFLKLLV